MRPLSPFTRALRGPLGKPSFPCPHHFPWRADLCLARSPRPKQKAASPQKSDADGAASLPLIFETPCRAVVATALRCRAGNRPHKQTNPPGVETSPTRNPQGPGERGRRSPVEFCLSLHWARPPSGAPPRPTHRKTPPAFGRKSEPTPLARSPRPNALPRGCSHGTPLPCGQSAPQTNKSPWRRNLINAEPPPAPLFSPAVPAVSP
jgi:hypothetical protein